MSKRGKIIAAISSLMAVVFVGVIILSLNLTENPQPPTVTAAPTAAPVTTVPAPSPYVTLSFIGDCIIGSESGQSREGNFTWYAENKPHDYFFKNVVKELSEDTLTFANVECVITDRDLEKAYKDYSPAFWFKAPTKDVDILTLGSVEVAGIVNNHTKDYGEEGYQDTKKALEEGGLAVGEDCIPMYFEEQGIKIGVVYAHLWAEYHLSYVEDALKEMEGKCDYRIVFFHGGEEAVHQPDDYKIKCARKLAEEGQCDLIVGSHPHVLQPMEVVNGVPIVYSLGNFCYSASNYPENKTIIFQVLLTQAEGEVHASTRIIPCYVYTGDRNNWQPDIVKQVQDYNEILDMMKTPVLYSYESRQKTEAPVTQAPVTQAPAPAPETDPSEDSSDETGHDTPQYPASEVP